jgi:DNA-binding NtrC family response regulator
MSTQADSSGSDCCPSQNKSRNVRALKLTKRTYVRELRNVLERAAILCEGGLITAEYLSLNRGPAPSAPQTGTLPTTDLNVIERELITKALANCKGNKSKAAAQLGISRTQLYVRLRKYQLS